MGELFSATAGLHQQLEVFADGRELRLPDDAEGIIALNVWSYGGGADLWGDPPEFRPQALGDRLLEVCTVTGVSHLGAIQAGTRTGTPLCQCRRLEIHVKADVVMQVDGEPWRQRPTVVKVDFLRQSKMLQYNPARRS